MSRPEPWIPSRVHRSWICLPQLNAEGVTVVMITHDPGIAGHAKRVVDIFDGEISERKEVGA